jgi:hypothetical protein
LRDVLGALPDGADEAAAIEACRSMDYRGKAGWPSMVKVHEVNVKTVFAAMKQRIASRNG